MWRTCAVLLVPAMLAGCASVPSAGERRALADSLAAAREWQSQSVDAGRFNLVSYSPRHIKQDLRLTIYLEGDGFAWMSPATPSSDPTPRDPLALRLALAQQVGNAAYIGRPCQYVDAERTGCAQRYWTHARFDPDVVGASNMAIDTLKQRFGATQLTLVGYSGGGVIAALLAARRDDVARLITVAGTLDHRAWTAYHHVQPLTGSLNATDVAERLAGLPQTHFVGGKDRIVPLELAKRWPNALLGLDHGNLRTISDFGHACCWAERWAELIAADR